MKIIIIVLKKNIVFNMIWEKKLRHHLLSKVGLSYMKPSSFKT